MRFFVVIVNYATYQGNRFESLFLERESYPNKKSIEGNNIKDYSIVNIIEVNEEDFKSFKEGL